MTKYLLAFAVFVAAATVPHAAQAMSAFAGGIPSSVASRGLAVGDGYNFATRAGAEAKALEECRAQGVAPQDTRDLCSVIAYFDGECLSVALDPAAGTPGWGWAIAKTADLSKSFALAYCQQTAGASRAPYCAVTITDCDTTNAPSN
jgi:hypothetical protein